MTHSKETPLMRQYWEIKSLNQDKILLFRMGDFFEMFFDDAVKAAPILGIALTQRNKKSNDETPMCGVPHHSIAGPINKLLSHGLKVAICDQIEDPKFAKGIVKRAVTRVLTPGMVYDSETLDATQPHYIACLDTSSVSLLDTTTGEAFYFVFEKNFQSEFKKISEILPIVEVIISQSEESKLRLALSSNQLVSYCEKVLDWGEKVYGAPITASRLLSYVVGLNNDDKNLLATIHKFERRTWVKKMGMSATVVRHLELFQNYRGEANGSLYQAINRTRTSSGSRLLRQYLNFPLTSLEEIKLRQEKVEKWISKPYELKKVRESLSQMGDIERRLSKIALPTCNARDLLALSQNVYSGLNALEIAQDLVPKKNLNLLKVLELAQKIEKTISSEPPLSTKQGHIIQLGVSLELDELIHLSTHSQDLINQMEQKEKELTGISSLKIRYNNVFGYYIEITNTHKDKAPNRYQRKQTLANAERYCTDELIELERKVLSAQSKRNDLEYEYFENLRKEILTQASDLLLLAQICSEIDVMSSFAWLAIESSYTRPQFINPESQHQRLLLKSSRHPVVEQVLKNNFIANDIELYKSGCMLLTGPNMAGKSTLMRQVALTAIMAQMGSFVPAEQAVLPIFDSIFTRIGASDQLTEGLSTFMVEMVETSEMLKSATENSLVILDEVGRGTSTYDGMCLAQAILEHLLSEIRATTFFATHYHELTSLAQSYHQIINAHMTVADRGGQIKFLHTLVKGPALKSYGIHVAQLAGLPESLTKRAKSLLKELEGKQFKASSQMNLLDGGLLAEMAEISEKMSSAELIDPKLNQVLEDVKNFSINKKTPLEALQSIQKWQESLN